ncbi:MAG: DUF2851 family protein [Dehalococcoidia bacterium]|nr:DUF2851 family protein [Dehalococcoidia bacterium]
MKTTPALADLLHERMRERTLARLWREEAPRFPWLECADGRRLRLLYPGRPAVEGGPDFRDALLQAPDDRLLRGDVELHLRPRGWREHGHDRDPRYNATVLHVVLWPDSDTLQRGERTRLEAGVTVPVASLFPVLQQVRKRKKNLFALGQGGQREVQGQSPPVCRAHPATGSRPGPLRRDHGGAGGITRTGRRSWSWQPPCRTVC